MAGRDFVIPDLQDGDPCPDCGTPLRIGFGPQLRRNLRALIELPAVIVISAEDWSLLASV